jgi:hypothetical protein
MMTNNAHQHDGVYGDRRSGHSGVCRLLLWSARGFDTVNLDEADKSDCVGTAGG